MESNLQAMPINLISPTNVEPHPVVEKIFAADGALDLESFLALLTPDIVLRIGSQPELQGHAAVSMAITGMFAMMRSGIRHTLHQQWQSDNVLIYEATAEFFLKDGRDITLPYVNVLSVESDERVSQYKIYIDLSPLNPMSH